MRLSVDAIGRGDGLHLERTERPARAVHFVSAQQELAHQAAESVGQPFEAVAAESAGAVIRPGPPIGRVRAEQNGRAVAPGQEVRPREPLQSIMPAWPRAGPAASALFSKPTVALAVSPVGMVSMPSRRRASRKRPGRGRCGFGGGRGRCVSVAWEWFLDCGGNLRNHRLIESRRWMVKKAVRNPRDSGLSEDMTLMNVQRYCRKSSIVLNRRSTSADGVQAQ